MAAPLIGIDLLEPQRLAVRLERTPSLETALFTAGEVAYCTAQPHPAEHLAARFCAKEAVVKALGIDGFDPLDVEVVSGGADVSIRLHGPVAARAEDLMVSVSISMSHLGSMAAAVAQALPIRDPES